MGMNIHLFTWTSCHTGHNMDPLCRFRRDFLLWRWFCWDEKVWICRFALFFSVPATIPYFLRYFPILPHIFLLYPILSMFYFANIIPHYSIFANHYPIFSHKKIWTPPFLGGISQPSLAIPHLARPWSNIPSFREPARRHGVSWLVAFWCVFWW